LEKTSIAPVNAICGHLPRHHCHKLSFQVALCSGDKCDFNTFFGSITCYTGKFYFKEIFETVILNYLGRTVQKLSLHDRFFFRIMNYQSL
jgi:hypothetical protein